MYLTFDEYKKNNPDTAITEDEFTKLESRAEDAINSLTFNRISDFEKLTAFQQLIVVKSMILHINFLLENAEILESPIAGYSISGVSINFDKSHIRTVSGVTTSDEVISTLMQSGLMYRGI